MTTAEFALFVGLAQATDQGRATDYIDRLINAGISRYWFSNAALASIFQTAVQIRRSSQPITFMALFMGSGLSARQQMLWAKKWQEARDKEPVTDVAWLANAVRTDAAVRQLQEMVGTAQEYMRDNPRDILVWLPSVIQAMRSILETGQCYDPRPSVIWETGYVPRVVARLKTFEALNDILAGGLWDGALAVWGTPTSQGKSTLAYTMIAHAVASGLKTVLFSREASAAEATARVVQAYGGFTASEVEAKQGNTPEAHERLLRSLRELDRYVAIYDRHSATLGDFAEIVHWEKPILVLIDHIGLYGVDEADKGLQVMGKRDPLGELADRLLDLSRTEHCTIIVTSQFSFEEQAKLYKTHDLNPPQYYGSMRIAAAADFCYIAMRHWAMMGQEWIKCKKCRPDSKYEGQTWTFGYDARSRSYFELRQGGNPLLSGSHDDIPNNTDEEP